MEYTQEQCKTDTMDHILKVREFMLIVIEQLTKRSLVHDQSKLVSPEIEIFTEYTPKLKNSTYGSEEYKSFLSGMGEALKHHYEHNSHHPEHFKKHVCIICFKEYKVAPPNRCETCMNGTFTEESDMTQMNLLDVIEMFCDWKAATMRHADGDIYMAKEKVALRKYKTRPKEKESTKIMGSFHNPRPLTGTYASANGPVITYHVSSLPEEEQKRLYALEDRNRIKHKFTTVGEEVIIQNRRKNA